MVEITRKTIAILIMASLIVTTVGTWIILEQTSNLRPMQTEPTFTTTTGKLSVEVVPQKIRQSKGHAEVTVNILS